MKPHDHEPVITKPAEVRAQQHVTDVDRAEGEGMSAPPPVEAPTLGEQIRTRSKALWSRAREQHLAAVGAAIAVGFLIGFITGRQRR